MKTFAIALCAALVAVAAGLSAAVGAPAGKPVYENGATFIYDNGRVEQVRAVRADRVVWAARSGRTYERAVNPVVPILAWSFRDSEGTRRITGDPDTLFPLKAGKQVQFQSVNETRNKKGRVFRSVHLWRCNVRALQTVITPAGAFEAYPIICDRFSPNTMRLLERLTWHYSEDVGHYVMREARDVRDGTSETYKLYAALPPWEANPVRIESLAERAVKKETPL